MSTTLCPHCQAVSLDDEKLGGTTFTPEDGEPFLYFGRDVEGSEGHFSIKVPGFRADEFPDLPRMQLSAANGCSLCGLLRSVVLNEFPPQEANREGPDTAIKILVLKNFEYCWHSLEAYHHQKNSLAYFAFLRVNAVVQSRDNELSRRIYFEICAPPGPLATWLRIPWNLADENALSPGRIRDIKSWISDCEQNCHHLGITETLPTRLIDIGSEDGRDQMRLILSSDIQTIHRGAESCKYATLSYCWGDRAGKPFFTTEKSTLQNLLQSIPMECIPCTFRDAVAATRNLGIRYLWIDALCIVQDDSEDWAKESAIMGKIYTNSYVTLVALQGESCHDGFLHRETARKVPIYYKSSLKPHVNGIYWLRQVSNGYADKRRTAGKFGAISYDANDSRWNTRGWTVQEKNLSTRRLMFGAEKMYYDCGVRFRTENMDGLWTLQSWSTPFLDSLSKSLGPRDVYFEWYAVVESYSYRDLTYPTDRFPAISGIAKKIHERVAGNYLAGLWRWDLFNGLLWSRLPWYRPAMSRSAFIDSLVHPKHYIAPTWSWAHSQNNVAFVCRFPPYPKNVSEIEILEARTALTGPNPFGCVQDGHLLLRGKTFGLHGARIFGIDRIKVDWLRGNKWCEAISQKGFEIARCALDWEVSKNTKYFELFGSPGDQLMMMIIASHSIERKDEEDDEDREDSEDSEGDEAEEDENEKSNASTKSDDDINKGDEDNQNEQDEADSTDGEKDKEDSSPGDPREYFGLLLIPSSEEADSWVRVGVFTLRNDKHGRAVLDNCCVKVVRII